MDYRVYESKNGKVAVDISNISIGDLDKAIVTLRSRFGVVTKCIAIGVEGNDVKRIFSWNREKKSWSVVVVEEDVPDHQLRAA